MAGAVRHWWSQPDHYEWMISYLDHRGVLTPFRNMAAAILAALAAVPALMIISPVGPRGAPATVVSAAVSIFVAAMAAIWVFRRARRPSRFQSKVFSICCSGCVATVCLIQSQPLLGLLGCTAFVVLTTYISFFHTAGYMLVNLVVGAGTAIILAIRIVSSTGDFALMISALILLTALNLAVPLAVQSLLRALGMDLSLADRDPLTGLLNRRAFWRETAALLARHRADAADRYLVVMMIDLDRFKQLNDQHGHAAGDRALISVAAAIRGGCRRQSVVGRAGGEEFVVAEISDEPELAAMAHRLRQAIADLPIGVTASIGTAGVALADVRSAVPERALTALIQNADDAMYNAKRAGGDRVDHFRPAAQPATPPPQT